ncbi:carbohydrate-binding protein [Polaribacter sp. 20A6]|uniref:carbohydrate-binding protein n=1 Tax=Polaribacter sp. 20A6 TaxID=2687289 RepID=UPI0013FD4070|nr:carbohydrate-binding protein [Polaribacter sp. 20A6]
MKQLNLFKTLSIVFLLTISQNINAQTVKVNSLSGLLTAIQLSNQEIIMESGNYNLEDLPSNSRIIGFSGSNNTIDLTGVHIDVPVGIIRESYILVQGSNNTIKGGEIEDVYRNGLTEITDFVAYHQDASNLAYGLKGAAVMTVSGEENLIDGLKLTPRGSHLYGYGSMYGINQYNTFGMNKRCGLLINGAKNTLNNVEVQMRSFGHGIYMQGDADETVIKNCLVEGRVRAYAELYNETDPNSFPYRSDYKLPETSGTDYDLPFSSSVLPIPIDEVFSLSEDGIRAYTGTGSVTVENCTVKKMRGGIRLYLGASAMVTNTTAIDCGSTNFNMPSNGIITNSSGNFAYAPLSDFRLGRSGMDIEWTILPSPNATGPHNLADVQGNNHNIIFHRSEGEPVDSDEDRAIVVTGNNSTITNETEYAIVLDASTSGNTIYTCGGGLITDNGTGNMVIEFDSCEEVDEYIDNACPKTAALMEAECYDSMNGIRTEDTKDTGGGTNVSYIDNDDWVKFEDINLTGMKSVSARNSGKTEGASIEVYLDDLKGDLIATIPVSYTKGWQNWITDAIDLDNSVNGIHDVFFVFKSPLTGSVFNVNWLGFSSGSLTVNTYSLDHGIEIFPNPVLDKLSISLEDTNLDVANTTIVLYTINGQEVMKIQLNNKQTELNFSELNRGIYILKINNSSKIITKKIIKI